MSDATLSHRTRSQDVTVGTAVAVSSSVLMADMAGGMVCISGVTATATLTVYGSTDGVSFASLYGHDGQPASMVIGSEGGACPMPDAVYPLRFVKLVSGTDLGTAASVVVSVKS